MMLTPDQVAEMLIAGEMFPKGFAIWLAAHDAEVRADEREKAVRLVWDADMMCNDCQQVAEVAIRGGQQA